VRQAGCRPDRGGDIVDLIIAQQRTRGEIEPGAAERVVGAFAAAAGAGVASLDGQMLDRPHLLQSQRILAARARAR